MADGNAYEEQRLKRIAQNQATLLALGLHTTVDSLVALKKPAAAKSKGRRLSSTGPASGGRRRRSARLQGQAPAKNKTSPGLDGVPLTASLRKERSGKTSTRETTANSILNRMRINSMSDTALRLRIKKIRNLAKMSSFIEDLPRRWFSCDRTLPALRKWWPNWRGADGMGMVGQQELEAAGLAELAREARYALRALLD